MLDRFPPSLFPPTPPPESHQQCLCGDTLTGLAYDDKFGEGGSVCGVDYTDDVNIPEYKFLCSGDSRVLCGTDDYMSVYSLDGSTGPAPSPVTTPSPVDASPIAVVTGKYEYVGCRTDVRGDRVSRALAPATGVAAARGCGGEWGREV